MNEHMWKKCGEVKAFAEANIAFLKKGKSGLRNDVFTDEEIDELIEANRTHRDQIDTIAEEAGQTQVVDTKAEATGEKLKALQEDYLTDEDDWEDPMELLEWSGFFHGGAVVHWGLIIGAAQTAEHQKLRQLAEGGHKFHQEVLNAAKESLQQLGETASE